MNTMSFNDAGRLRSVAAFHEWPLRWTLCGAMLLAAIICVIGVQGWRAAGLIDLDASHAALSVAQEKAGQLRGIEAQLPDLRKRVAAGGLNPEHWTAADALHAVASLAAQSGLHVTEIEPLQTKLAEVQAPRALRFRAEGGFAEMKRFIEALAGLPRLVIPEGVQIRRRTGVLSIDTTLRIHDDLPAVPLPEPARTNAFVIDPFGKESAGGFSRSADLLLVGTLLGRHRAMALMQSSEGVGDFRPGEKIGDEWLGRVRPRAVELASDDGASRTLSFAEDRK
ncbi:type 4a pilus biogenesis protein PilO [Caballeronia sp. GAWG2-1]|uniref:type 4a pilus biogenesis protein PilO n=1 Tax=Caballeronia sp. GAWG2-1 TaxID=2921744 RepID=UPI002028B1B5|nr:type 4a pilus biogenesis protein PilO [Caballeronia sp. GAWG2-1]